jgi:hypothetical protein
MPTRFVIIVAGLALLSRPVLAHDIGCDGDPAPKWVKIDCCGKADRHLLTPDQITRGMNGEYIIAADGYVFVVFANEAQPSGDSCSYIFYESRQTASHHPHYWTEDGKPWTPDVYCFLTPFGS